MLRADLLEHWFLVRANIHGYRAAWMEAAAGRWMERAGNVPFQDDPLAFEPGVGPRDGRHERLGVRVQRVAEQLLPPGELDHLAQVHDGYPV